MQQGNDRRVVVGPHGTGDAQNMPQVRLAAEVHLVLVRALGEFYCFGEVS
jgi:hypothetical protein